MDCLQQKRERGGSLHEGHVLLDGRTGRLTPRGDARAFAEALVELAHDADKRARFGAAAQAHVRESFSLGRMVENYRRLGLGEDLRAGGRTPATAGETDGFPGNRPAFTRRGESRRGW